MSDPKWLRIYWPLFVILTPLVLFGGPEAVGVIHPGTGGTLSEITRGWLRVEDGEPGGIFWIFVALWTALAVWFPVHLLRKWPWERNNVVLPSELEEEESR